VVDQSKWLNGQHAYSDPQRKYTFAFIANPGSNQFAYNTKLVDPKPITSYKDFLKPEWKGKIVSMEPTDRHIGGSLQFFYYNPDLGPEFFKQFFGGPNVVFSKNTRQMTDWLASGKFSICLGCLAIKRASDQGLPIDEFNTATGFREGALVGTASGTVSIMNKAPNRNAAVVFVNWLLSREGQIELQKLDDDGGVHVNSARIDIPKDDVDPDNRLVEGGHYYSQSNPEWSNLDPIFALAKEIVADKAAKR
jgi:ABC-type Fe3+ transport system substrate-binding protein